MEILFRSGNQKIGNMTKKNLTTPHDVLLKALERIEDAAHIAKLRSDPEAMFNCAALLVDIYGRMIGDPAPHADADVSGSATIGFASTQPPREEDEDA